MPIAVISIPILSSLNFRVAAPGASSAKGWLKSTTLASYSIMPSLTAFSEDVLHELISNANAQTGKTISLLYLTRMFFNEWG